MMNIKVIALGVFTALIFTGGYRVAAHAYGEDIAELREDYATRAQALEAEYREKEKANAQAVIKAWEERDAARTDAVDLRGDLERVRDEAAALRRELSRAADGSGNACEERLAECAELCRRGAELLERGAREFQSVAADKDAVVGLVR